MNELSTCELPAAEVGNCTHTFILRNLETGNPKIKENISLSVTESKGQLQKRPFLTVFNQDNKPYTPAFINSREQVLTARGRVNCNLIRATTDYNLRTKSERVEGLRRVKREKLLMMISHCLTCVTALYHITHQIHHKNIEHSIGNNYIQGLIVEMNRRRQKERETAKIQKIHQRQGKKHTKLSSSSIDFNRVAKEDVLSR